MKTIIALLALLATSAGSSAKAEEMAKSFVYQYTPNVEIVLLPDVCDKADLSQGWIAYAENEKHEKANGCWQHSQDGKTIIIVLDIGDGKYLDYQLYAEKFTARY